MAKKAAIDRRVARSRTLLHDALLALIPVKGYEAITVRDICARAKIGRSTFYAHYTGKDDLMRSEFKDIGKRLERRQGKSADGRNPEARRLAFGQTMFEHARDRAHLHRSLLGNRGGAIALDAIREMLSDVVRTEIAATRGGAKDGMPREFVVRYLVGAFMGVVTWWLESGTKLTPAQIDALFQRLAGEGVGLRS